MVLLNDPGTLAEALDCLSVTDVLVASESGFSKAAAALSDHIKVRFLSFFLPVYPVLANIFFFLLVSSCLRYWQYITYMANVVLRQQVYRGYRSYIFLSDLNRVSTLSVYCYKMYPALTNSNYVVPKNVSAVFYK